MTENDEKTGHSQCDGARPERKAWEQTVTLSPWTMSHMIVGVARLGWIASRAKGNFHPAGSLQSEPTMKTKGTDTNTKEEAKGRGVLCWRVRNADVTKTKFQKPSW